MVRRKIVDGRRLRSERSREAVAGALLALLEDGVPVPTARAVADRAGVSLRLVHHHFRDREALFAAAARLQNIRTAPLIQPIDPDTDFATRLAAFVPQRARLLEAVRPVRRAAVAMEPLSKGVRLHLDAFRRLKREQIVHLFAAELCQFPAAERKQAIAAACCAASWSAWEELRGNQSLSITAARNVMSRILRLVLTA